MYLGANDIAPQYTLAFEFLKKWVPVLNTTFEPEDNGSTKRQKSDFSLSHPTLLALLSKFRTFDWADEYKYPTVVLSQMNQLLAECKEG